MPLKSTRSTEKEHCAGCVFYPPNLPASAYPEEDFRMLQQKTCAFDFLPEDPDCMQTRKTSCSLIELTELEQESR